MVDYLIIERRQKDGRTPQLLKTGNELRMGNRFKEGILAKLPDSCLAELLDADGIVEYLETRVKEATKVLAQKTDLNNTSHVLEEVLLDLQYLVSIGELPEQFQQYVSSYTEQLKNLR